MEFRHSLTRTRVAIGWTVTAGLILLSATVQALPFQVTIQPINVCDNNGLNCGNPTEELFFAETRKIWAQADVEVTFLAFNQFDSSSFQTIDGTTSSLIALRNAENNGKNSSLNIINMWFLDDIGGGTSAGLAFIGSNGIAIADEIFSLNRLDTIAHEIGHNFGLDHASANNDNFNLMRAGGSRFSPATIGDITPDGSGFDQLNESQVGTILTSEFITEADQLAEPSGIAAMLTSLLFMTAMIRAIPVSRARRRS
jgi:hypothetical protein